MHDPVPDQPAGPSPEPIRLLLAEYMKAALVSDPDYVAACRNGASQLQTRTKGVQVSPGSWALAMMDAEADPEVGRREVINPMLPTSCPLDLEAVAAGTIEFDRAVQVIRESASFG